MSLLFQPFIDMWRALVKVYVQVLRAFTGRQLPNYRRIYQLEIELGFRTPIVLPLVPVAQVTQSINVCMEYIRRRYEL